MNTPICDFVKQYANSESARFHMPGHKGKSFLGIEHLDITEIDGADVLYNAKGIIKESEQNAASLFGSGRTLYSAEGSSLSIRAMLYLTILYAKSHGRKPNITAFRNVHKAFVSAAALLDIDVTWVYPESQSGIISCEVDTQRLDGILSETTEKPVALYVTSPDYLGNIQDISALSKICKKHGMLLLVDNAHGAYLRFLPEDIHPITLGADMCCDSAHKTFPVLTGGAYLHISDNAPAILYENSERAMSLFSSTSPSYLILQSLDAANKYLSTGYKEALFDTCAKVTGSKQSLTEGGYSLIGDETLKITIAAKPYGYYGTELSDILLSKGVVCEFCDKDYIVFMVTPENVTELERLINALLSIEKRTAISEKAPCMTYPERKLSIREALMSQNKTVSTNDSIGRIFADASLGCPPAIPIIISGEVIDENTAALLEYYGTEKISVVE